MTRPPGNAPSYYFVLIVHFLSALCDQVTMMRNARVVRPQVAIWDILVVGPWTKNRLWQALFCVSETKQRKEQIVQDDNPEGHFGLPGLVGCLSIFNHKGHYLR